MIFFSSYLQNLYKQYKIVYSRLQYLASYKPEFGSIAMPPNI